MTSVPSMQASAVLVWLEAGRTPTSDSFHVALDSNEPPRPNPEPWWELKDAIVYAVELEQKYEKYPWIKSGDAILSPKEILEIYKRLKA